MKLPWKARKERIDELEQQIERLEEEKSDWKSRFEAEETRRKKLSREKQEAEEELNKLRDRLRSLEDGEDEAETSEEGLSYSDLGYQRARNIIEKMGSVRASGEEIYTVYIDEGFKGLDRTEIKNSLNQDDFVFVQGLSSATAFADGDIFSLALKTRSFFEPGFEAGNKFNTDPLIEFMEREKTWVLASLGDTKIFREKDGDYELVDEVKTRVDHEHSKGGFSQGRFERKRDEQVEEHAEAVSDKLEGEENVYLLGNEDICAELPGEYLGGYDPNMKKPEAFYGFQLVER